MKKLMWTGCAVVMGLTTISLTHVSMSFASVPARGHVTDDTAIYQNLSDIKAQKQADLNFDGDIERLSSLEGRYKEKLPTLAQNPRLKGPMGRVAARKYRFTGTKTAKLKLTDRS